MHLCRQTIVPSQEHWEKFKVRFMSVHWATAKQLWVGGQACGNEICLPQHPTVPTNVPSIQAAGPPIFKRGLYLWRLPRVGCAFPSLALSMGRRSQFPPEILDQRTGKGGAGKVKPGATTATLQFPHGMKVLLSQTWRSMTMRQRHRIMPLAGAAGAMCQITVWHCKAAGAK